MSKRCTLCGREQSLEDFYVKKGTKDGRTARCKMCIQNNPGQKATNAAWQRNNPDRMRAKRHRIPWTEYQRTIEAQGGRCAACLEMLGRGPRDVHIDHDHRCCARKWGCGECFRGILCGPCNRTLGQARDDTARLKGLLDYLEKSQQ